MPETLVDLEARIVSCRRCPRLVEWRERMGREKRRAYRTETYWANPVPGFGDEAARILAVGLAPGAHGSNRTGRMFTGDASGDFLFPALFRAGLADRPSSSAREDGLALRGLFISAVCRCAPPENQPAPQEINNCLPFLLEEIRLLREVRVLVALGRIAYDALLRLVSDPVFGVDGRRHFEAAGKAALVEKAPPFAHGLRWEVRRSGGKDHPPLWIVASYHPSRQNTQTGRLTRAMFDKVWRKVRKLAFAENTE